MEPEDLCEEMVMLECRLPAFQGGKVCKRALLKEIEWP